MASPLLLPPLRDIATDPGGNFTTAWQRWFALLAASFKTSAALAQFSDAETPVGNINGLNKDFTLAHAPVAGSLVLVRVPKTAKAYVLILGRDYSLTGKVFSDSTAPASGESYRAWYRWLA